jgi:proline iminopeptidase
MCTPPRGAFDLHRAWPESALHIIAAAGHRWKDPALASAVIRGLASVADQVASPSR